MYYNVWDEITYPSSNFNSATIEVWEWLNNLIPHLPYMLLVIHAEIKVNRCLTDHAKKLLEQLEL